MFVTETKIQNKIVTENNGTTRFDLELQNVQKRQNFNELQLLIWY